MKQAIAHLDRLARSWLARLGIMAQRAEHLPAADRTLFVDVERRLNMYLRALWGQEFVIRALDFDNKKRAPGKPSIVNRAIHLPSFCCDLAVAGAAPVSSLEIYRAASAHAAAHVVYGGELIERKNLSKWQIAVISVIEDARIEALSVRRFPGLKDIWARLHRATPADSKTCGDYLNRLARALLDDGYQDCDSWIDEGRGLFKAANLESMQLSREIGLQLAHSFMARQIRFRPRTDLQTAPYRDDNRHLWFAAKADAVKKAKAARRKGRRTLVPFRFAGIFGITNEAAGGDDQAEEIAAHSFVNDATRGFIDENSTTQATPFHYGEWDYQSRSELPSWVTLREKRPKAGNLQIIDDIISQHKHVIARMKVLLDALKAEVQRVRKQEEGDEIDINAAIRAHIDTRLGVQPDTRIMMSSLRKSRDISVLVLVDLSKSMNERVRGQRHTVMQLTQQACVLLADAIEKVGDPFAIHGFHSDGRHDVQYFRFKDFDQPYDDTARARIAGMYGRESTRMGAAIRHSTNHLKRQKSRMKLLLVITDGEPSDVDSSDRQYLHLDTKMAIEEASHEGVKTYCMNLDPRADEYVARIFGVRNFMVVDHLKTLPEKLVRLYAGLTR